MAPLSRIVARPWRVIALWAGLVLVANPLGARFHEAVSVDDLSVIGSESVRGSKLQEEADLDAPAEVDVIVFRSSQLTVGDPAYRRSVDRALGIARDHPAVTLVISPYDAAPQVSEDGHTAIAVVGMSGDKKVVRDTVIALQDDLGSLELPVRSVLTGETAIALEVDERGRSDIAKAELLGFPIAFALLLLAFGSLMAALLPLLSAAISVTITLGVLGALSTWVSFAPLTENVVTIIGLGLGIDFSMFVVSRHRESRARGATAPQAMRSTLATTGRAVQHSAVMVVVSLAGLALVRNDIFRDLALAGCVVTLVCALVSLTLLPAVLTVLADKLDWGPSFAAGGSGRRWARYSQTVVRHRVPAAGLAIVILVGLASPLLTLELGLDRSSGVPADLPAGRGLRLLDAEFDSGLLTPVQLVLNRPSGLTAADLEVIDRATLDLADLPGVDSVFSPTTLLHAAGRPLTPDQLTALADEPGTSPLLTSTMGPVGRPSTAVLLLTTGADFDSAAANRVVGAVRGYAERALAPTGLEAATTGATATAVDLISEARRATPLVVGYLLLGSFAALALLVRAPVVAAKAVVLNLLGVGAAYGALVWAFQDGHLTGVFGSDGAAPIQAYLPVLALAVLFGISMDYEVFLIARIREEWHGGGDPTHAIARGLALSGGSITLAAAIQVAVFGAFAFTSVVDVQQVGFALAAAILIDATLVRVLLTPALMGLLGRWNWVGLPHPARSPGARVAELRPASGSRTR